MALGKGLGSLIPSTAKKTGAGEAPTSAAGVSGVRGASASGVWHIPLSSITPGTSQPRKHFDQSALEELADSIRQHGVVQPVVACERPDGTFELIAGERRLRASRIAGLVTIPALVKTLKDQEKIELALIENIQREDLNPIEEAFAFKRLMEEFTLTIVDIGKRVGKAASTISNSIRLLALPAVVQKALQEHEISMGHARALLGLKTEKEILDAFESMRGKKISVRDIERTVLHRKTRTHGSINRNPQLFAYEERIRSALGTKVAITNKKGKGSVILSYYSDEELKRLVDLLTSS